MDVIRFGSVSKYLAFVLISLVVVDSIALRHLSDSEWNRSADDNDSGDVRGSIQGKSAIWISHYNSPSVAHFAHHRLCSHPKGQEDFYRVLKSELCRRDDSGTFAKNLVEDLCRNRHMLKKWVGELFDMDNDGYISHVERNLKFEQLEKNINNCVCS